MTDFASQVMPLCNSADLAEGGRAVACVGSVAAPDFAERFIGTAVSEFKGLDRLYQGSDPLAAEGGG